MLLKSTECLKVNIKIKSDLDLPVPNVQAFGQLKSMIDLT